MNLDCIGILRGRKKIHKNIFKLKEGIAMKNWQEKSINHYRTQYKRIMKSRKRSKNRREINIRYNFNPISFPKFLEQTPFRKNSASTDIISKSTAEINIPQKFSLFSNPDEVLNKITQIQNITSNRRINKLFFDHSKCEELELGASVLIDVFLMNLIEDRKNKNKVLNLEGVNSKNDHVSTILEVSGLFKTLNMNKEIDQIVEETHGIEKLDLLIGGKHSPTMRVNPKLNPSSVSTQLIEYFQKCIEYQGYKLSEEGQSYLSDMIGEIVDNAILHSGSFSQWFMLANYFIIDDNEIGECNIVIFNFGQSIYNGMFNKFKIENVLDKTGTHLQKSLHELTKLHKSNGFFKKGWTEETLWTLYALQEGISRCKTDEDKTRGTGTIKLIESFQSIGQSSKGFEPKMCILSGHTHILFDDEYRLINTKNNNQIITFNKEGNFKKPPNPKYVKSLNNYFPGTLISFKFYLDRAFLESERNK